MTATPSTHNESRRKPPARTDGGRWSLERALFAMAGTVVLLSVLLAALVSPWFLLLTAFVGVSQLTYVAVGDCPASLVLRRFGFTAQCSW